MKNTLLLFISCFLLVQNIQAQTTAIPDTDFEAKLIQLGIDSDGLINGQVLNTDIMNVQVLDVNSSNISDLTGINAFTALTELNCSHNQLTSLTLSNLVNLEQAYCYYNQISTLTLNNLPNFRVFVFNNNQLTSLATLTNTNLSNLEHLSCGHNPLTVLNVNSTSFPKLKSLDCRSNQLSSLNISNFPDFEGLICPSNQLTSLNLLNLPNIKVLDCQNNLLSSLDYSQFETLTNFSGSNNQFTTLPLTNFSDLEVLSCGFNPLTSLSLSNNLPNLYHLSVRTALLTSLTLPNNLPSLEVMSCSENLLTSLVLPQNCPLLQNFRCYDNQLNSLILPQNLPLLSQLHCYDNQLTSLLLPPSLPNLTELYCQNNLLTTLNLPTLTLLEGLNCSNNLLQYLNLKGQPYLTNGQNYYNVLSNNLPNMVICVDDPAGASISGYWVEDNTASYSEVCQSTTLLGYVKYDNNNNCQVDLSEAAAPEAIIQISDNNNNNTIYKLSNASGLYVGDLDSGSYNLSITPPNPYVTPCLPLQSVSVDSINDRDTVNWALQMTHYCPYLNVSISAPFLRMTGGGSYYVVSYCNDGTAPAYNAYVEVTLDPFLNVLSTAIPIAAQLGNTYTFDLDTIGVGECGSFRINMIVDTSAQVGQTHCSNVHIYPDSLCNNIWTGPIIQARGICNGNSVTFELENIGANMVTSGDYSIFEDNIVLMTNSFNLNGGANTTIPVTTQSGKTYRIEATQTVGYPIDLGPQIAYSNVQNCNNSSTNLNVPLLYYNGNPAPWVDVDCQQNVAAYDPNDKAAQQIGFGTQHYIEKGTPLDYKVRFQNTGNDTAFTVVILDTISPYLDLSTLQMKSASHNYTWSITNGNTLTVNFPNIKLVDSLTNEPLSHGFFRYEIQQKNNLALETVINNQAAIYFDYNPPIFTNTTWHTIGENFIPQVVLSIDNILFNDISIHAYPNPFKQMTRIEIEGRTFEQLVIQITDVAGRLISVKEVHHQSQITLHRNDLLQGIYFYQIKGDGQPIGSGKLMVK